MTGELFTEIGAIAAGLGYQASADAFSFDAEPRAGGDSHYLDPPRLRQSREYLGGQGADRLLLVAWLSTEAGQDPAGASRHLMDGLRQLRAAVRELDLDVLLLPSSELSVAPRGEGDVYMVGVARFEFDVEDVGDEGEVEVERAEL